MFTIGIFSTHLPYFAFVFFYACIFIFGSPKVAKSELPSNEKSVLTVSQATFQLKHCGENQIFHYHDFLSITNPDINRKFEFEKQIKHGYLIRHQVFNPNFIVTLFNRPPPEI